MDTPERVINWKWNSQSKKIQNVKVVDLNEIESLKNSNFIMPQDCQCGDVLIRHPYNQGYIQVKDAKKVYQQACIEGVFLMAKALCATKVSYKECMLKLSKREQKAEGNIDYKAIELDADIQKERVEELNKTYALTREYEKTELTQERYERAKKFAEERGLSQSNEIKTLLDQRDPQLGSQMKRQKICIETCSSLNQVLDIAFKLTFMRLFKLDIQVREAIEEKEELKIEWDIEF